MKSSIRKFLLINLLLTITVTTTLTALGNYYLDKKVIQEHLDTLMAVSALSYQALLGNDVYQRPLKSIQNDLNQIPEKIRTHYRNNARNDLPPQKYIDKFDFQVWGNNKLILHSLDPLNIPLLSNDYGFRDQRIGSEMWRIFSTDENQVGIRTVLSEHYDTRIALGHSIAEDDLYIMLLTFPLSGLLIWIIIGRGLGSLDKVAREVANRASINLEPVNLEEVPEEIKPVIDELNKLFYRLNEGFEREKRFAADAAHELRTPLTALKVQAQVALNTTDLEEKNQALKKLIVNVNRSAHIVQQLLTMSRLVPEASRINDIDKVDLPKITREVLALLTPSALEKQIELEFTEQDKLPIFFGNSTAIEILIRNLVDNAIRYCEVKGNVLVKVYQSKSNLILEVHDNGPGIPPELHARIFERFFRVLGNKSTGSGLGLAIVRQVTELHGGSIELDKPKEGTGLIVRILFPLHPKPLSLTKNS